MLGNRIEVGGDPSNVAKQQEATPSDPAITKPPAISLPPPSDLYSRIEKEIEKVTADNKAPPDVERAWLIRTIAQLRVLHGHESVYRLIVGSQLTLLMQANTPALIDSKRAREIYEQAKNTFPEMYANFSFENWLNYPINSGLVQIEPGTALDTSIIRITPLGRDFLHYLVNVGLTSPKLG